MWCLPSTHLEREQLVDNAENLSWKQRPRHIVVLIQGLAGGQTPAVHLWVHDLADQLVTVLMREMVQE